MGEGGINETVFRLEPEGSGSELRSPAVSPNTAAVACCGSVAGVKKGYGIQIGNGHVRSARPTKQPW
jgi:hypothetical protein